MSSSNHSTANRTQYKDDKDFIISKQLVPYEQVYTYDTPIDTVLPSGIFVKHMVNPDTTDKTLYIKYGNQEFDSLFMIKNGLELSTCHYYKLYYATPNNIGIAFLCMNTRGLTILPLNRTRQVVEYLNPLYIGAKDGITISLLEGDGNADNGDSLLVANLDFNKKQYVKIKGLVCGDPIHCFEEVKVKGDKLYLSYTGAVSNADPRVLRQLVTLKLQ